MEQMSVTILNHVGHEILARYTSAVTYIGGQITEARVICWPANSLHPAWRKIKPSGPKGREVSHLASRTFRTFEIFYYQWEFENPVPYMWRGHGPFPARAAFPLETKSMIVKLSCSDSAETPDGGYSTGESLRCPHCNTMQRIVVIESNQPLTKNRTTGAGSQVTCEDCGALFSGEKTCCPACAEEDEFNSKALAYAISHGIEF